MPTATLPPAALAALQRGNLIEAIKIVRVESSLGLKEAKEQIEQYLEANPQIRSKLEDSAGQASYYVKLGMVMAIAVALAAWYLLGRH